jgi:hypothetical protein
MAQFDRMPAGGFKKLLDQVKGSAKVKAKQKKFSVRVSLIEGYIYEQTIEVMAKNDKEAATLARQHPLVEKYRSQWATGNQLRDNVLIDANDFAKKAPYATTSVGMPHLVR